MRSLLAENANPDELRQQHQQIQTLHQQLGNQRFETMLQVREILTPEQRSQMAELIQQHRGRRGFGARF
jgi:Spy/CpxP family protein refolding chaperone